MVAPSQSRPIFFIEEQGEILFHFMGVPYVAHLHWVQASEIFEYDGRIIAEKWLFGVKWGQNAFYHGGHKEHGNFKGFCFEKLNSSLCGLRDLCGKNGRPHQIPENQKNLIEE